MIEIRNKTILFLSPHTDDVELGCGGTMSNLIRNGNKVYSVAFSTCEESVPAGFPKDALAHECKAAMNALGLEKDNLIIKNYPVRKFNFHRQDILEFLVKTRNKIQPDIIFLPSSRSIHQDHLIIHQEGIRAFKQYTCMGYELPWDTFEFPTTAFVKLDEEDVQRKVAAIKAYKTQEFRRYSSLEFIRSVPIVRGTQIGVTYAEAFELIRVIF